MEVKESTMLELTISFITGAFIGMVLTCIVVSGKDK